MPVEQIKISLSPQIARFIRGKVKAGGYTDASEVVRTAVRRMQEEELREAKTAGSAVDRILEELSTAEKNSSQQRARKGLASLDRGEFTEYRGRTGLAQLVEDVRTRGTKLLSERARKR
jgi:putative addiction module CopG family antidote